MTGNVRGPGNYQHFLFLFMFVQSKLQPPLASVIPRSEISGQSLPHRRLLLYIYKSRNPSRGAAILDPREQAIGSSLPRARTNILLRVPCIPTKVTPGCATTAIKACGNTQIVNQVSPALYYRAAPPVCHFFFALLMTSPVIVCLVNAASRSSRSSNLATDALF